MMMNSRTQMQKHGGCVEEEGEEEEEEEEDGCVSVDANGFQSL